MDHTLLRKEAKASLAGEWMMIILGTLVYLVINGAASFLWIGSLLVYGPLTYGYIKFLTKKADNNTIDFNDLFSGFSTRFMDTLVAGIIVSIAIGVGTLLLIVPGIIAACGLSQTFFIMADHPELSATDAIKMSWHMMDGRKMDYFVFILGFIGWLLLVIITCGLLAFYVEPYMTTSMLGYYRAIVNNAMPLPYKG